MRTWGAALIIGGWLLVGCSDDNNGKDPGTEGGPCYSNGTCNAGLTCASGTCVKVPGPEGGIPDGAVPDTAGSDGAAGDTAAPDIFTPDGPARDAVARDGSTPDAVQDAVADAYVGPDFKGELLVVPDGQTAVPSTVFQIKTGVRGQGTLVLLSNVVVSAVDNYGVYTGDVFVQDSTTSAANQGIQLFINYRTDGGLISDLAPGDHVAVEGTVAHWNGPTSKPFPSGKYVIQLKNNKIAKLSAGSPPTPAVLTAAQLSQDPGAAAWCGSLVKVAGVRVLSLPDPLWGDFGVSGGLDVDDELYPYAPTLNDCLTVTGISTYFYKYNVCPRAASDVAPSTACQP